jgi:RNA recognition motif-containing protein
MSKTIYVANLPFNTTEDEVKEMFSQYGEVEQVNMIMDRETGRFRGFGFIQMTEGADEAIAALNGQDFNGRDLRVNEARPKNSE